VSERSGFFIGQIGASIRLDTEDTAALLAAATTLEIHYRLPKTGATGIWTATLSGTKVVYTTTAITDLPLAGTYIIQSYLEGPGWALKGRKVDMIIAEPLIAIEAPTGEGFPYIFPFTLG